MTDKQWRAMLTTVKQLRADNVRYWVAFAISDGRRLRAGYAWWDEDVLMVGPDSSRIVPAPRH